MITLEALKAFGANVEEGMARCMNNEPFYLRLVGMALKDENPEKLKDAVANGDLAAAFEAAHNLKGIYGNLALTPLFEPARQVTELLRARADVDYTPYVDEIFAKRSELESL